MRTVIETPTYLRQAKGAGATDAEMADIVEALAEDPTAGEIIPGTGGARKVRFAKTGQGKRGGYRVIHYYAADDVPVFLLAFVSKGQRADISQAERGELRKVLAGIADAYRAGVKTRVKALKVKRRER